MSKRKIILIISLGIIVLFFGIAIFSVLKKKNANTSNTPVSSIKNLFNFGGGSSSNLSNNQPKEEKPAGGTGQTQEEIKIPRLRQITTNAVAGAVAFLEDRPINPAPTDPKLPKTEKSLAVRWVESATGHISEMFLDQITPSPVSNTTIPGIHDAHFDSLGQNVVLRYLNTENIIETYLAKISPLPADKDGVSKGSELVGSFLPENISDISVSPKKDKFFYLFKPNENQTSGIVSTFDGTKKSEIFSSVFNEWLAFWGSDTSVEINTKPASSVPGYAYSINTTDKSFRKLLGGISGVVSIQSPDGKYLAYTSGGQDQSRLFVLNTKTNTVQDTGLSTNIEKCLWSKESLYLYCAIPRFLPKGNYPDDWYQGFVSFSDEIWKISVENGFFELLVKPEEVTGESIDAVNLFTDTDQKYLFFTNKTDSTLWSFNLTN